MLDRLKYIIKKNRVLIMVVGILLVCSIALAIGVYAQITNKGVVKKKKEVSESTYEELKDNFNDIFNNQINKENAKNKESNYDEILYCAYDIQEEKSGKYKIDAKLPLFKLENNVTQKINTQIKDTFAKKILEISNSDQAYTTYNLDYTCYINGSILSLIIKCNYKDGANPQRILIQTYNYDLENNKLLTIDDLLNYKELERNEVQEKIDREIKKLNEENEAIKSQGYNVYTRNENDKIYKVENTPNFFIGQDEYLYLVYAYGNNNYTSEMDLIIF